nr:hypothetical protein HK105_002670 [Polyrhizophydium stewartii]
MVVDMAKYGIGALFVLVMIIYAGVRAHKVATQMPATYVTTTPPNKLPIDYLNQLFPSKIPDASYEFPAFTVCPESGGSAKFVSCFVTLTPSGAKKTCDANGMYTRVLPIDDDQVTCLTVNDAPGVPMVASDARDVLTLVVSISGAPKGSPDGALVTAHHHLGVNVAPERSFENFFGVSAGTMSEVVGKKKFDIGQGGDMTWQYDIKATNMRLALGNQTLADMNQAIIEFRYPKLEITYEKEFLPLDMNNWLGEVGGVACLLFFLLRLVVVILEGVLTQLDAFSMMDKRRGYNDETEGFANL